MFTTCQMRNISAAVPAAQNTTCNPLKPHQMLSELLTDIGHMVAWCLGRRPAVLPALPAVAALCAASRRTLALLPLLLRRLLCRLLLRFVPRRRSILWPLLRRLLRVLGGLGGLLRLLRPCSLHRCTLLGVWPALDDLERLAVALLAVAGQRLLVALLLKVGRVGVGVDRYSQ